MGMFDYVTVEDELFDEDIKGVVFQTKSMKLPGLDKYKISNFQLFYKHLNSDGDYGIWVESEYTGEIYFYGDGLEFKVFFHKGRVFAAVDQDGHLTTYDT